MSDYLEECLAGSPTPDPGAGDPVHEDLQAPLPTCQRPLPLYLKLCRLQAKCGVLVRIASEMRIRLITDGEEFGILSKISVAGCVLTP